MNIREPRIRDAFLTGFQDFIAARHNWSGAAALKSAGLAVSRDNHRSYVSLNRFATFMDLAARHTGDDCIGLHAAEHFPLGTTGALYYMVSNSGNLSDAIGCIK